MRNDDNFDEMISDFNADNDADPRDEINAGSIHYNYPLEKRSLTQQAKQAAITAATDIAGEAQAEILNSIQCGERDVAQLAKKGLFAGINRWLSHSATGRAARRILDGKSTLYDLFEVTDSLNPMFALVHQMLNSFRHGSCEQLCYDDMIKGIIQNRPKDPAVAGCCVLQENADLNTRVVFIYIDANDEPIFGNGPKPYGFYLLTKSFDDELNEAFGGEDMLVIK